MAITTDNDKLALINMLMPFQPNTIISPETIDQADQQQLLWGFPGDLWLELSGGYKRRLREQGVLLELLIKKRRIYG